MSRLPWHPVLFAVVVVLTAWLDAAVSPYAAMRSLVVAMVCAVIVTGIAGVLLRSAALGAIATSVMIGLLWSRQLIEGTIAAAGRMGWFALVWVILLSVTIILVARAWRREARRTKDPRTDADADAMCALRTQQRRWAAIDACAPL